MRNFFLRESKLWIVSVLLITGTSIFWFLAGGGVVGRHSGTPAWNGMQPRPGFPEPISVKRVTPPWDPHRAVVVAMPMEDIYVLPNYRESFYALLKHTLPVIDVVVLFPEWDWDALTVVRDSIEKDPELGPFSDRLFFVPSKIGSRWIRDFGPLFAHGNREELIFLDFKYTKKEDYLKLLSEKWTHRAGLAEDPTFEEALKRVDRMKGDDDSPSFLARFVRNEYAFPVDVMKIPVMLDGGDFLFDGKDTLFLSENTLYLNGSNRRDLEHRIATYLGIERVAYLETLPGNSVPHLDVIAKFVAPDTILMAELTHTAPPDRTYLQQLYRDVDRILEKNVTIVRSVLPKVNILRVPLPPVQTDPPEVMLRETKDWIFGDVATRLGLNWERIAEMPSQHPERMQVESQIRVAIRKEIGQADFASDAGWDQLARHYVGRGLRDITRMYVEEVTVFRTFLNSLYLDPPSGAPFLLFPVYSSQNRWDEPLLEKLEAEAMEVYREALPGIEIKRLNCDESIALKGAIHCYSLALPDWDRPQSGRSMVAASKRKRKGKSS